ncbi:hypothetical protein BTA51_14280 [Hahella sp. CCB-MM4]|uniref:hypothetical protein n=1 Tax=Hahella sp. (strain CCB-MM4) TaxID=1926491 RepID=UPI000B9C68F2|nr:hypothetical protein [Hahella sp. CCB-MM4]OZG72692.1 hypothetical protein BTA51_14280 [Hahella sp. CCB-MM4]
MSSGISTIIDEIYQLTQDVGDPHNLHTGLDDEKLEKMNALWEQLADLVVETPEEPVNDLLNR